MYLMKTETGEYTLKKVSPSGVRTVTAHPARFSPDDKFSRHRVIIKRRFGLLPFLKDDEKKSKSAKKSKKARKN